MNQSLPSQVEVTLPDDSTTKSKLGSGPVSLANTSWSMYRASTNRLLTRIRFNEEGGVAELYDNVAVAAGVFGSTIKADGVSHSTATKGVTYTAGSYGAENDSGFSFELKAKAFYSGFQVGTGTAYASGTHDGQNMEGIFGFKTSVTGIAGLVLPDDANASDEFEFYATRISEDGD